MNQYRGIKLEKRNGVRRVSTQNFKRFDVKYSRCVTEIKYRIAESEHRNNCWCNAAEIKSIINMAFEGRSLYQWIFEKTKTQ